MDWLQGQVNDKVLEVRTGQAIGRAGNRHWTNVYIRSAYQKGLAQSASRMRAEGAQVAPEWVTEAFARPFHVDRVALAFTRTFNDLKGITDEMDKQISRVLADGLSQGKGPMDIARSMTDRVGKIGITRARMLARTEVIRSHADASLNVYEEAQADGVLIEAEFATARDDAVCQECQDAANAGPYTLDEARGMIPLHPNCRCAYIPVLKNPRDVVLR
jgi:SPP1 gp7 family putative phage head morphogenesis protein